MTWDPARYGASGAFVPALGRDVLALLDPRPGERTLDLGCGDGALTAGLAAAGAAVVGLDASPAMAAAARARGLRVVVGDARALPVRGPFDAVFSNAALHWVPDAEQVVAEVALVLAPGGRFVAEQGGHGNIAAVRVALAAALSRRGIDPRPLDLPTLPTAEAQRRRLEAHGLAVMSVELFARPTPLPGSLGDWLGTFAHPWLAAVGPGGRRELVGEVTEALAPALRDDRGRWWLDYVRLRWAARRP